MAVPIALEPHDSSWLTRGDSADWMVSAIEDGGGERADLGSCTGLVWAHPDDRDGLAEVLRNHPEVRWVQLPFAGVEAYSDLLDDRRAWTCAKGIYGETTAEHALTLLLAGFRGLGSYLRADGWSHARGRNLFGAAITIVGGGGIATALIDLLGPFSCDITVVRRTPEPVAGATCTLGPADLHHALRGAEGVVLALPLTEATTGIIDERALASMGSGAWLVNVARGGHVVTNALVSALRDGVIAGAALDVTDPEPLPAGHPLWGLDNCIVTPHVANTHEMLKPRLSAMVTENVRRFDADEPLLGTIDPTHGY